MGYEVLLEALRSAVVTGHGKVIRRHAAGRDLLVTLSTGHSPEELTKKMERVPEVAMTTILWRTRRVIVRPLDGATTGQEVVAAANAAAGTDSARLVFIAPARPRTMTACIEMECPTAARFMTLQKMQLGWSVAQIKEFVEVDRWYRCNELGHRSHMRALTVSAQKCFNCGRTDHRAAQCGEAPRCATCAAYDRETDGSRDVNYRPHSRLCQTTLDARQRTRVARGREVGHSPPPPINWR